MRYLAIAIIALGAIIMGLSIYLQPDDLRACGTLPGDSGNCRKVDAIVVVSGGDTVARTDEAIKFYQNGWADMLIFSGAAQDKSGPSNAEAMLRQAIAAGVPENDIRLDEYAETTKQNAENLQNLFSNQNIQTAILMTSGYHQRRASLEFHAHITGVTILDHPVAVDKDWSGWWWLTPRGWWLAGGEMGKIIAFYLGGSK